MAARRSHPEQCDFRAVAGGVDISVLFLDGWKGKSYCRRRSAARMLNYLEVQMPADRGSLTLRFTPRVVGGGGPEHTTTNPCSRQGAGIS
jgi:hypothetical protein